MRRRRYQGACQRLCGLVLALAMSLSLAGGVFAETVPAGEENITSSVGQTQGQGSQPDSGKPGEEKTEGEQPSEPNGDDAKTEETNPEGAQNKPGADAGSTVPEDPESDETPAPLSNGPA